MDGLIRGWAELTPDAPALLVPDGAPLSYRALDRRLDQVVESLRTAGVLPGARIASMLADGTDAAVLVLAAMRYGASAPLNPAYRRQELEFYLADLRPDALVVGAGIDPVATDVASGFGLPVLTLTSDPARAPEFQLRTQSAPRRDAPAPANGRAPNTALLLHTSGTTSRPKLVPLTRTNVAAATTAIAAALELSSSDRCLNVMPLFHIHGLSAVFASLAVGGSVVCTPGFLAPRFFDWFASFLPTWYTAAPTIHRAVLDRAPAHAELLARYPLRFIRSASAPMPPQLIDAMEVAFHAPFIEAYGMTEAAPQIASNRPPPAVRRRGSVGQAAGNDVAIRDGEVVVRGPSIMAGYDRNDAANREQFVDGWFRTGDLGHLDEDGHLYITGRLKDIINRGGEKIAPREVEEVLLEHPSVHEAVVFPMPDDRLGEDVAAAVVTRGDVPSERELKALVAAHLADFKVPRRLVFLDALPQGATAKLQRRTMATLLQRELATPAARVAAPGQADGLSETEAAIAALWSQVLGTALPAPDADFFRLGGDSILGGQLLARVGEAFGVTLPLLSLFEEAATVRGMAACVAASRAEPAAGADHAPIPRIPADADAPLSFAQEGLWFADQLDPGHPVYNVYRAIRLVGPLRADLLEQALNAVIARHEALRTCFPARAGRPMRVVAPAPTIPLARLRLATGPDAEAAVRQAAIAEARRPFDVGTGPILRALLLESAADDHTLVLVAHHIAADAWSLQVLLGDLAACYGDLVRGRDGSLPPLVIDEREFAAWQRQVQSAAFERDIEFWRAELAGAPPVLALRTDRPRPPAMEFRGARRALEIPAELTAALRALGQREGATLFMTLLAAYALLLREWSDQDDVLIGTPVAGRARVETEPLIGAFLNTLVFRVRLGGDPAFTELLARIRDVALRAFGHADVPFNRLVEALTVRRTAGRSPLIHVKFRLQNVPLAPLDFPGLEARLLDLDYGYVKGDLGLELVSRGEGLAGFFEYSTELFDAPTIARMHDDFLRLLRRISAQPATRLRALTAAVPPKPETRAMAATDPSSPRSLKGARRQAMSAAPDALVRMGPLVAGEALPLLAQPALPGVSLLDWAEASKELIDRELLAHGAILFRGFDVPDVGTFERFAKVCTRTLLGYSNRSTPRSRVSGDVYTSTEFPADQTIPMHNEMSYTTTWPLKLWFHCVTPSLTGGETPFADSALVFQRLSPRLRERFAAGGVLYVRNFGGGIDLPWQEVFQTSDRGEVETFCRENGITCEWLGGDRLRTRQVSQAVARHPVTGVEVFFNQAHLFNVGALQPPVRDAMLASFAREDLPRNSYYGDGSDIEPETLDEIRRVYDETAIAFPWQAGDIVIVDNMLVAHGRRPFTGPRKIVVAMAESYSADA